MILTPTTKDENIEHTYERPYIYSVSVSNPTENNNYDGNDLPPYTIFLDMEPEIACVDLPKIVKSDGLERYKLEYTRVRVVRFYCLHKEGEKPSGNGTKEKPWNNFNSALEKLEPLCKRLCADYVQLIVLPESDMVTCTFDFELEKCLRFKNFIVGSLDGETFCKITLMGTRLGSPYYSCTFSQCEIHLNTNRDARYTICLRNVHKCTLYGYYIVVKQVTDSTIHFAGRVDSLAFYYDFEGIDKTENAIIYNSKIEHTEEDTSGYALRVKAIIDSTVNLGFFDSEPIILNFINSKLSGTCTSYDDFHIDHIYKSNIELIDTRIKDIRTIIDSSISIKSDRQICIRLSGGCGDKEMVTLGVFAIISNVKIDYIFTPINYTGEYWVNNPCQPWSHHGSAWGALVFCLRTLYDGLCNPVVVSNCDCTVSIQEPPDAAQPENIWYCVFPPNCGLPSQCHVIKGEICNIDCWNCL